MQPSSYPSTATSVVGKFPSSRLSRHCRRGQTLSAFDSSRDCLRTFSGLRVWSEIRFLIAEVILLVVRLVPSVRLFIVRQMLRKEFKLRKHFVGTRVVEV